MLSVLDLDRKTKRRKRLLLIYLKGGKIRVLHVRSHVNIKPKISPAFLVIYAYSH